MVRVVNNRGRKCVAGWAGLMVGLVALALAVLPGPAVANTYKWVNDVPRLLEGTWVKRDQRCEDENSQVLIFSSGGYRWRQTRTEWGFARGKYSWESGSSSIYFRVQRFVQQDYPDFQFVVVGPELRKFTFGSGVLTTYDKCPDFGN